MPLETIQGFRLSPIQRRLWTLAESVAGCHYRVNAVVSLKGKLSMQSLQQAINQVVARHESLRTRLHTIPGMSVPVQVITDDYEASLQDVDGTTIDWRRLQEAAVDAGPALQASLAPLSDTLSLLLISAPAACADPASVQILVREIARFYANSQSGSESALESPLQYADLSEWLNEKSESKAEAFGRKYWRQALAQADQRATLSFKTPSSSADRSLNTLEIPIAEDLQAQLLSAQQENDFHVADFLLAAWNLTLQRLGYKATTIGVCFDGRAEQGFQTAIGPLSKLLPVSFDAAAEPTFIGAVQAAGSAVRQAAKWQDYFFWESLAGDGKDSLARAYFKFAFDHQLLFQTEAADLVIQVDDADGYIDTADFRLTCSTSQRAVSLRLTWSPLVCATEDASTLAHCLAALVADAVKRPHIRGTSLKSVSDTTQEMLFNEYNPGPADFSGLPFIHEQFALQAVRTPHAEAARYEGLALTYEQLNERANRLARQLRSRGIGPDNLVGVYLNRSLDLVVALLGVLKSGAAYVPLDPKYPLDRIDYIFRVSTMSVIITSPEFADKLIALSPVLLNIGALGDESDPQITDLLASVDSDNAAYVIYTSGSTGEPKGVAITHGAIRNHMAWVQSVCGLTAHDRMLQKTPFSFDASVWEFFAPLLAGGVLVIARPGGHQDAEYLVSAVQRERITFLQLVPMQLRMMLEQNGLEDCRSLQQLFCGGEPLTRDLVVSLHRRMPWVKLFNLYGPTECAIDATFFECHPALESTSAPIGRPISNTQVYVLDSDLNVVPPGIRGELCIGGHGVARGYVNCPDLTSERFVPHPNGKPGERLYRTGDEVRWLPDRTLEFLGRLDYQVKLHGYRIELGDIEAAILDYQQVRQAVAIIREDTPGEMRLCAYVVPERGENLDLDCLMDYLSSKLPEYMIPATIVKLDKMPLTSSGKLDRKLLPEPKQMLPEMKQLPRDEIELELAIIWKDVLKLTEVGRQQNFFDVGGHSLLAISLMRRVKEQFGQDLPLSALFENATIEHVASLLRQTSSRPRSNLVPIQTRGDRPPLFFVHPSGGSSLDFIPLAHLLGADQPFYGLSAIDEEENDAGPILGIEERATRYIKAIRSVQPHGPYILGGWSFGAYIAYEMAQQLRRDGQEVARLLLLDIYPETAHAGKDIPSDDAEFLVQFANNTRIRLGGEGPPLGRSVTEFAPFSEHRDPEDRLSCLVAQMTEARVLPPEINVSQVRNYIQGIRNRERSLSGYELKPYDGSITLIRVASDEQAHLNPGTDPNDLSMGWEELCKQGVQVLFTPGVHSNMVYEPHVQKLAGIIKTCLAEAGILSPSPAQTARNSSVSPLVNVVQ